MNVKRRIIAKVQCQYGVIIQKVESRNKKDLRIFLHISCWNEASMAP